MDRYAYSGVAFSSAKPLDLQWCKNPDAGWPRALAVLRSPHTPPVSSHAGLPQPDVILFMRLGLDAASARGGFGQERYESSAFQSAVMVQFDTLASEVQAEQPGLWVDVDAAGSIEEVHGRVRAAVAPAMEECAAGRPLKELWHGV